MLVALAARGLDRGAQLPEVGRRQRLFDVACSAHRAALLRGAEDALGDADERLRLFDAHLRDAYLEIRDPRGDAAAQAFEREVGRRDVTRALCLAYARARSPADVEEHLERRGVSELTGGAAGEERSSVDGKRGFDGITTPAPTRSARASWTARPARTTSGPRCSARSSASLSESESAPAGASRAPRPGGSACASVLVDAAIAVASMARTAAAAERRALSFDTKVHIEPMISSSFGDTRGHARLARSLAGSRPGQLRGGLSAALRCSPDGRIPRPVMRNDAAVVVEAERVALAERSSLVGSGETSSDSCV